MIIGDSDRIAIGGKTVRLKNFETAQHWGRMHKAFNPNSVRGRIVLNDSLEPFRGFQAFTRKYELFT